MADDEVLTEAEALAQLRRVRCILFDLDGTLQDSYNLILASFKYCTKELLGRDIPDAVLMQKVGQPLEVQMRDFTDDPAMQARLCEVYREHNARVHNDLLKPFPGMVEALARLRAAGYVLGVVTSKRHEQAQTGLEIVGLAPYIDFLVGSDDWPEHKPAPGSILHGCELADYPPDQCMYVGDSPFDMQAANAAGCISVAAVWGMFPREALEAEWPWFVCENIADLVDTLLDED